MSRGGPSVMDSYQTPSTNLDYPGESVSGDTTVQGRDYRAQSVEYFKNQDSSGGTVVSYATSGYKSDAPDIDFDDKQAYESIDRFQERRVVAHPKGTGTCPPPAAIRRPGVDDMPDYVTKKGWLSLKKCLCFFIILSLVTLLVAIAGTALAVYTFFAVFEGGRILGTSPTAVASSDATIEMLQAQLNESRYLIEELRSDLSVQTNNYAELSVLVASLITQANMNSTNSTEMPTNTTSIFAGCETQLKSRCSVDHTLELGSSPLFSGCTTPEVPLERSGFAVVDKYCVIDNIDEPNPISSNLIINDSEAACSCFAIASSPLQHSFACELFATYCPL